jgi:hypothetical protein
MRVQHILNLLVGDSIRQQQDHPRPHHIARMQRPRLRHLLQFLFALVLLGLKLGTKCRGRAKSL